MVSQAESGATGKVLNRLEGLPEMVGLEVMVAVVRADSLVHIQRAGGREFQIVEAVPLKLWAPNEVPTNGMEDRLTV